MILRDLLRFARCYYDISSVGYWEIN